MGARRIFFPGVGKLGVWGRKSSSGVRGYIPVESASEVPKSPLQVVKIMHQ